MNVMAEAHKKVKTLLSMITARYKGQYAAMLKVALIETHKDYKAMQIDENMDLNEVYKKTVRVNTHQLKEGDIILHHWCLFRLVKRTVYTYPSDLQHDEKGTVQFTTECLFRGHDSAIPKAWIDREGGWTVQGNSLASWALVSK